MEKMRRWSSEVKRWSRKGLVATWVVAAGCGSGVVMTQDGNHGGTAQYVYREHQGAMMSSHRAEAFRQIRTSCPHGFVVIKEGPVRGRQRVVEGLTGQEIISESWWGIRFACRP